MLQRTLMRIPDWGLLDRIYLLRKGRDENHEADFTSLDISPIDPVFRHSDVFWFCFLPALVSYNLDSLPQEGNVYTYFQPPKVGSAEVGKTRLVQEKISGKALSDIQGLNLSREQINFLSLSMGNAPAFYLAGNGLDVNKIVSVVPGDDLPWCIQNSIGTGVIAKNARTNGYYHEDLDKFSPGRNIGEIHPETQIDLGLGGKDKIVPYESQRKLAIKAERRENTRIRTYKHSGHIQTIRWFSNDWQKR